VAEGAEWPADLAPGHIDLVGGPGGSVAAALAWVALVARGRIAESWPRTGPGFRLHLARHWAWNRRSGLDHAGREPLEVANDLAEDGPGHPLWAAFAAGLVPAAPRPSDGHSGWVAIARPEPVGPDLEVVQLLAAEAAAAGRSGPPLTLVLWLGPEGWLVEGHGRTPARPSWPPHA
jgi:hypothetical protein